MQQTDSEDRMVNQIIAGAEQAFLESGYDLTTMDSVARRAGVARGSVYNHFSSKEVLFLTVMQSGTANFVERATHEDSPSQPPLDRLRLLAGHFLRAATEPASLEMYRTVVAQAERFPDLSALFYSQGLLTIELRLRSLLALAEGELIETPELAADRLLSTLMGGYFSRRLLNAPRHPADESIEEYVDRAVTSLLKTKLRAPTRSRP